MDDNELRRKYAGGTAVVDTSDTARYYYALANDPPAAKPEPEPVLPRDLSAGLDLDRLIAEQLGWREISERKYYREGYGYAEFEQILVGIYGDETDDRIIPKFSTDLNMAITLFTDMPDTFTPCLVRMIAPPSGFIWTARIMDHEHIVYEIASGEAKDPALAICRAWLAWKDLA